MNPISVAKEAIKDNAPIIEQYAEQEYEYVKLKVFYQISAASTSLAKIAIIGSLVMLCIAFCSVGLAIYLGTLMGNEALGFLSVGGIYLLFGIIAFLLRAQIETFVIKAIAKKYYKNE